MQPNVRSTDKAPYVLTACKGIALKETHFVCSCSTFNHTNIWSTAICATLSVPYSPVLKRWLYIRLSKLL